MLTSKEQDVLSYMRLGLTNKQISRLLGMTVGTVKAHVRSIYRALHIKRKPVKWVPKGERYGIL